MSKHFKTVGLIGRNKVSNTLDRVHQFLTNRGIDVITDPQHACDLIITVGGDGSLLHAGRFALAKDIPIIGINCGRLGFLTDINPDELEPMLSNVLDGDYVVEKRLLLEMQVEHQDQALHNEYAINDIVLKQGNVPNMLAFDIHIDNHCIAQERADGIIIATPTGSTAYALSGGGPILHPGIDAYLLLNMFSHTLSNRPLVVPGHSKTCLTLEMDESNQATFRCDGLDMIAAPPGSRMTIQKADKELHLLHPRQYNYFDNLRNKLGWGNGHVNKR